MSAWSSIRSRVPEVPIILISGNVDMTVNVEWFTAILPKLFTQTQLIAEVSEVVPG